MGLSFDILIFDCLLKAPQPVTGLFLTIWHREMAVFKIVTIPDTLMTLNIRIVTQQIARSIQIIEIKG